MRRKPPWMSHRSYRHPAGACMTKNIDGNTKGTKALIEEVGDNVRVIKAVVRLSHAVWTIM
jgi:hypothetical protein